MGRQRLLIAAVLGVLTIAARLPFVLSQKIPFDADEAVEGLMARHVLNGEFPIFLWGQSYKGVPEVYVAAGVFSVFGSSVTALKLVTLVLFALFVALNFLLLEKLYSRYHGVASSLLLIVAPPALVFWSLSASAEYVLTMLLGTIVLLLYAEWERRRSPRMLNWIAFVIGFALWVHQIFIFYLGPLALIWLIGHRRSAIVDRRSWIVRALAALSIVELVMALLAFVTGGITLHLGGVVIAMRSPQKMLGLAIAFAGLAVIVAKVRHVTRSNLRKVRAPAFAFLLGYLPVLLYSIFVQLPRSPTRRGRLPELIAATPDILGNIVPIILGIKTPTTERLPIPAVALLPAVLTIAAYAWTQRYAIARLLRRKPVSLAELFFPLFFLAIVVLFLASGAYVDTQSYRYLIPIYAVLVVAWVIGSQALSWGPSTGLGAGRRSIAWLLVALIAGTHAWQQVLWYRRLTPDFSSTTMVDCLRARSIHAGYADYWTSYKLTFISRESVIIAPTAADRYPPYSKFVASLPVIAMIHDNPTQIGLVKEEEFVERERFACGNLTAVILERRIQKS